MTNYRHLALSLVAAMAFITATAQNTGSNSSYSRFGLGTVNDQAVGFNKGMAGVHKAIRMGNRVNPGNPASYSAIDSLTMVIDAGATLSMGRFEGDGASVNANNCSLDYVAAGFRLRRGLGFSIGLLPYTTIGYSFATDQKVGHSFSSTQPITSSTSYRGEGGLHQAFVGVGWNPFSHLSVGANISYVWGDYIHTMMQTFSESGTTSAAFSGMNSSQVSSIKTYKIDLGVQYPLILNPANRITFGATASLGHNVGGEATLVRYNSVGDSLSLAAKDPFDLPYTVGVGAAWENSGRLMVAADYNFEKWGSCHSPVMQTTAGELAYTSLAGAYLNRHKVAAGVQYVPDVFGSKYTQRMHYRLGAHYSTPYLRVNGHDGPSECGITLGVGLPISNSINHGPMANVSLQWMRRGASGQGMIAENYFMLSIGVTFSESWFMKYKIR